MHFQSCLVRFYISNRHHLLKGQCQLQPQHEHVTETLYRSWCYLKNLKHSHWLTMRFALGFSMLYPVLQILSNNDEFLTSRVCAGEVLALTRLFVMIGRLAQRFTVLPATTIQEQASIHPDNFTLGNVVWPNAYQVRMEPRV